MSKASTHAKLSLQTKLLLVLSLILTLVLLASSALSYRQALHSNEQASEARTVALIDTFEKLIQRSTLLFENQVNQISVESYLRDNSNQTAPKALSLYSGINAIRILNLDGSEIRRWSAQRESHFPPKGLHASLFNQVLERQRPVSRIFCERICYQSSYIPVITSDGDILVINAVRDLQELIVDFASLTGADALLLKPQTGENQGANLLDVYIASNADSTFELLGEIQQLSGFLNSREFVYTRTSKGIHFAQSHILSDDISATPLQLAIIGDDQNAQARIQELLRSNLYAALGALTITIFLCYLTLRTTLKKLVNLSNAIAMLSSSNYGALRDSLSPYTRNPVFIDEVDQLNLIVLEVADALETMEQSVSHNRNELVKKIQELGDAQDFNDVLVNDSPLVIVAHTLEGKIKLLNNYARELSGWYSSNIETQKISDLILPDLSGRSITELLKPLKDQRGTRIQTEQLMRGAGGKVNDLTWIHARVNTGGEPLIISVGLDITERRRTESRLRWLSKHDNVTDLLNRESFHEEANLLIQQYGNTHRIDFALLDIDKFASINDMYGFQNGDVVLKETARYIERLIDCDTIIARTGPNEFSALMILDAQGELGVSPQSSHPVLGRALRFYSALNNDAVEITISGMLATYPQDGYTIDELVSNASAALRKLGPLQKGKINRLLESVDNRALRQERIQIHDNIVKALSDDRFILLYQPIYNLGEERITHCECLVRMRSEEGHLISPAAFMDIAKEHGLMSRLDLVVLRMALIQLREWSVEGLDLKLSVNITAATFESDLFIKELKSLLLETGAPPSRLIFEIVETEAIDNLSTAKELCERLAELDIQIAFDDFGIGFTSFEYLRDLPVDYIKIDQSFIRYLYKRKSDQLLVKSMVDMAIALGKKVIAEGVEDDGSADILRTMGVHYLQGYYISRPRAVADLELDYKMVTI